MLMVELSHHLDTEDETGNHCNGRSQKTVFSPGGEMRLNIPRDRPNSFEPRLVAKYQRRIACFDDHVISMYARGMSKREMQAHLLEL